MIRFFPKEISHRVVAIYVVVLLTVTALFLPHAMGPGYIAVGALSVAGFFYLSYLFSFRWKDLPKKVYLRYLIVWALSLRLACMTALYFFFLVNTGIPFEFETADALGYHLDAKWLASVSLETGFNYLFQTGMPISDTGYFLYLSLLYRIFGPNIFIARVIKCLLSTWTCVMIYHLASRTFGETSGRIAGIFCLLAPNLLYYCGLHLKETEMIFLIVAALEVADHTIRSEHRTFWKFLLLVVLATSLFLFRTVIGMAIALSVLLGLMLSSPRIMSINRKSLLIFMSVVVIATLSGGSIANEIQDTWENRVENQMQKRQMQTGKGNRWAKYATGAIMAPMMFVVPFPTMVDVDKQYNQQMLSGGNYVRNVLGIFVLIALFSEFFVRRNGRNGVLIYTFTVLYLGIVSLSGFSNSERFVLPALPFLLMLAAHGVTHLNELNYRWVKIWYWVVALMAIGWAIFKLGSRGIL